MKLHSTVKGNGPHLIIMHGVFGMSDNWSSLGRKWSEEFTVHLLDMRNHGRSPHSDVFSYEAMADDLLEYLDDHQIEKPYLLGHSMGGKVAMLFAVYHPERVGKMVVADIAPKAYKPHHQDVLEALHGLRLDEIQSRGEAEEKFSKKLDEGTRQFLLKSLYWKEKDQMAWRFNLKAISASITQVGEALPPNAFFDGPTLFVRGGASNYIQDEDLGEIHNHFPEATLETIAEAGHWLHAQKPKEFFAVVNDFLSA